jgi:uncharacterized protein (TIGR02453 family)
MMTKPRPCFSDSTLQFLEKAGRQKNPNWLDRHREEYESVVLEPLKFLATHLKVKLAAEAPFYHFPQKGIGRLKRPAHRVGAEGYSSSLYRNWMSYTATRPAESRFERNPSLFFMINPEDKDDTVLVAGGLYMPSSRQLKAIRQMIGGSPQFVEALEKLFDAKPFKKVFKGGFSDEQIASRVPRGFDPHHPRIEWIKLQGFYVWRSYSLKLFSSAAFFENVETDFRQALKLNRLLDRAIEESVSLDRTLISNVKKSKNARESKVKKETSWSDRLDGDVTIVSKHDF